MKARKKGTSCLLNIGLDLSDVVMELWLGSLHSSFRTKHHSYHCTVSAPKKAKWFSLFSFVIFRGSG